MSRKGLSSRWVPGPHHTQVYHWYPRGSPLRAARRTLHAGLRLCLRKGKAVAGSPGGKEIGSPHPRHLPLHPQNSCSVRGRHSGHIQLKPPTHTGGGHKALGAGSAQARFSEADTSSFHFLGSKLGLDTPLL